MSNIVTGKRNSRNKIVPKIAKFAILPASAFLVLTLLFCLPAAANDWPTHLHDIRRSGVTPEQLKPPLVKVWTYTSDTPSPAWTESPPIHDYAHGWYNLKPRQEFDRCFDVAVVGNLVYFGSSTSGAVTCLNTNTGSKVWTFFTGGPVRFAPHVADGRVFVGSDDGYVYCLNATNGSLIWSRRAGPTREKVWGNEHMISVWPVRGSALVDGSDVFWTAGIFPEEGMYICKRNAEDGSIGWTSRAVLPPQGYLLTTPTLLIVPTGKTWPTVYDRNSGAYVGFLRPDNRAGGCWALLTPDGHLWSGPTGTKQESKELDLSKINTNQETSIASVPGANYLIVDSNDAYYNTDTIIFKINRGDGSVVWRVDAAYPYTLIKAGDTLFAGGDGEIATFDSKGIRIWTATVEGKTYGLAVANGRLYASTDNGRIHCFKRKLP